MNAVFPQTIVRLPIILGMCLGLFLAGTQSVTAGEKLDINKATEAQLAALPGSSPELARLIVKHRKVVGHFANFHELLPPIAEARLMKFSKSLKIGPPTEEQKIQRGIIFGEG